MKRASDQVSGSLNQLVQERKKMHDQRIKLHHGLRSLRFLKNIQSPPKQFAKLFGSESINAPLAFRHVQTVTGAIAKNRPKHHLVMKDPLDKERKSLGERWLNLNDQYLERYSGKPIFWKWVDSVVADSIGVLKWTRHDWKDMPAIKDGEEEEQYVKRVGQWIKGTPTIPLKLRVVDPLTVLFSTYEWESRDVLEVGKRSLKDCLVQLRIAPTQGNISNLRLLEVGEPYPEYEIPYIPSGAIEVSELWTEDKLYIGIAGQWFELENPYEGIIPYEITGGYTTASNDPALEFISALFPFQKLGPWADTMLTAMVGWSMAASNPILATWREPGQGVTGSQEVALNEIQWGKQLDLGLGGRAQFLEVPDVGRGIKDGIELMMNLQDRASLSPAASGFMGTRTAGLAMQGAVENALAMFTSTIDNMQMGWANVAKKHYAFIEKVIGIPVYVSGFELTESQKKVTGLLKWGPNDVNKVLDVLVEIKRDDTGELIQRGTHGKFMHESGLWSEERSMLFSGIDDVEKERKQILKEKAMRNPMVEQYLVGAAIADEPPLAALYQELTAADNPGSPPGTPPEPDSQSSGNQTNRGGEAVGEGFPAPQRGGRPAGMPTAEPRGPNRVNPQNTRR